MKRFQFWLLTMALLAIAGRSYAFEANQVFDTLKHRVFRAAVEFFSVVETSRQKQIDETTQSAVKRYARPASND